MSPTARALAALVALVALSRGATAASGDYPADPTSDVAWSSYYDRAQSSVENIERQYTLARASDRTVRDPTLRIEYSQAEWDALSVNEKALYLSNKERVARGVKPFAAVAKEVADVAQDFADYLYEEGEFAHNAVRSKWIASNRPDGSCCSPWDRLDGQAKLNERTEFFRYAENLAWTSAQNLQNAVEFAIYNWIYADKNSGWGHRHFSLAELNDNAGESGAEGLLGFGVAQGSRGTYIVMNAVDESRDWDYTDSSNLYLWSNMRGGSPPAASTPSPPPAASTPSPPPTASTPSPPPAASTPSPPPAASTPSPPPASARTLRATSTIAGYDKVVFENQFFDAFKTAVASAAGVTVEDVRIISVTNTQTSSRRLARSLLQSSTGIRVTYEVLCRSRLDADVAASALEDRSVMLTALQNAGMRQASSITTVSTITENTSLSTDSGTNSANAGVGAGVGATFGILAVVGALVYLWRHALWLPEGTVAGMFKAVVGEERFYRWRGDGPRELGCFSTQQDAQIKTKDIAPESPAVKPKRRLFFLGRIFRRQDVR